MVNNKRCYLLALAASLNLAACQSGSTASSTPSPIPTPTPSPTPTPGPTPTPSPTPSPTQVSVESYINLLNYTPLDQALRADDIVQLQQSMVLNSNMPVSRIAVNFYSDSQCTNLISSVEFGGSATLLAGSYTTTTDSNLTVCAQFQLYGSTGCVYAYSSSNSLSFNVIPVEGSAINSSCMTNSAWSGERFGFYNLNQGWSRNCSASSSCGFSQTYTMNLN